MKTIKQIRDSNINIISEAKEDYLAKYDPRNKEKDKKHSLVSKIPSVIILKRKSIRIFPDDQYVGLYYSQALDKYITIPFGENVTGISVHEGNLQEVSQELVTKTYARTAANIEKMKDDETGDPAKKAIAMAKQQEKLKQLSYRMRTNVASSKDGKQLRPWAGKGAVNVAKEAGKMQVAADKSAAEKAKQKEPFFGHPPGDPLQGAGYIAGRMAGKAIGGTAKLAAKGVVAGAKGLGKLIGLKEQQERAQNLFEAKLAMKRKENLDELAWLAPVVSGAARIAGAAGTAIRSGAASVGKWALKKAAGALPALASMAAGGGGGGGGGDSGGISSAQWSKEHETKAYTPKDIQKSSSFAQKATSQGGFTSPTQEVGYRKALMKESLIDQLRELATKTDLTKDMLMVNEEQVDINSNIAEKVVKVYDSLNKKNKAKFAKMLGENKESFKKAVNFALRYE